MTDSERALAQEILDLLQEMTGKMDTISKTMDEGFSAISDRIGEMAQASREAGERLHKSIGDPAGNERLIEESWRNE